MDELFYGERLKAKNRGGEIFLATVATVSSGGVTLLFDGQETASTKKYKILLNGTPLEAGDRVAVVKHAGTYLVLGAIGLANPYADAYVKKTGDTMTGALTISSGGLNVAAGGIDVDAGGIDVDAGGINVDAGGVSVLNGGISTNSYANIDAVNQTIGNLPAGNYRDGELRFRDKLKTAFFRLNNFFGSDGRIGGQMVVFRTISGVEAQNILGLYIDAQGSQTVEVSSPASWRRALGLGSDGALPLLASQGGSGQTGLTSTTTISSIAAAASGFSITSATFSKWGKVVSLHMKITATSAVTSSTWTTAATLVSGCRPYATVLAHELNNRSAVIYSSGSFQVWGQLAVNTLIEIYATYLIS